MGLGKTIQIISFLASLKYSKIRSTGFNYVGLGPVLIVAPVTLIGQWVKEFHTWWPYFRVCVLHDIGTFQKQPKSKLIEEAFNSNSILITTYSSLFIYDRLLLSKNWHYVILDEGHKIRNPDTKITVYNFLVLAFGEFNFKFYLNSNIDCCQMFSYSTSNHFVWFTNSKQSKRTLVSL